METLEIKYSNVKSDTYENENKKTCALVKFLSLRNITR